MSLLLSFLLPTSNTATFATGLSYVLELVLTLTLRTWPSFAGNTSVTTPLGHLLRMVVVLYRTTCCVKPKLDRIHVPIVTNNDLQTFAFDAIVDADRSRNHIKVFAQLQNLVINGMVLGHRRELFLGPQLSMDEN